VLVRGETGTGKEVVARAIHAASARRDQPMLAVNCAALSENLLESELFGHEKGGIHGRRPRSPRPVRAGRRPGPSCWTDQRDRSAPAGQAASRVAGEQLERVGSSVTISTDVRVIATTNRDLEAEVGGGALPRGPFLQAQRRSPSTSRRCANGPTTSPTCAGTS